MAEISETPNAERIHIAFFGLRNAGKSTLVNEFCNQQVAIVSSTPGTTTDPVSKAMEILPLGPCLITDTAGLDDEGDLGQLRIAKTLSVLATTDIAVWVGDGFEQWKSRFSVPVIEFRRGDSVQELKAKIAAIKVETMPRLLEGIVKRGDRVLCVCPIDESAPKGRLILPQVMVIRECLDCGAVCVVAQPNSIPNEQFDLVITDSQAFDMVKQRFPNATSFSILFARQKGDIEEYQRGLEAVMNLRDGDRVLIAEGCTHHRQCNDIGAVKIPMAIRKLCGHKPVFAFVSGASFDNGWLNKVKLVVHCGACMLTRREVQRRIALCRENCVPITNYGLLLQRASQC